MLRNISDEDPDRDSRGGPSNNPVIQSLSCPDCTAANFPNLSKLNKHRNTHERPYNCVADGCYERFAQRQALTRHVEIKHGDAENPTRFYHCTVEGCKYSSLGRKRKWFTRADQVKEHIKDYGHYGPHSANDRPRRRGERIFTIEVITARFEEWVVGENGNSQPQRTIQSCEYNSFKTKLWHTDVTAEMFLKGDEEGARDGHKCPVADCYYYELGPPGGCETVSFKTLQGLQEHHRRAHESGLGPSLTTQLEEKERGCTHCSTSTDTYSSRTLSANSDSPYGQLDLLGLDLDPSAQDLMKEMEWNEMAASNLSELCFAEELGNQCYCQSCCQPETTTQHRSESLVSQLRGDSTEMHFTPLSSSSGFHDTYFPLSEPTTDTENYQFSVPSSGSPSLFRHDSLKSRTKSRLSCDLPGCYSTFRRKYEKQRHMKTVHSLATPYPCDFCDKEFPRKDKLRDHLRSIHDIQPTSMSRTKSMMSDSSEFSTYSAFSVPGFVSGRDVVPSALVKANSSSERSMGGSGNTSAGQYITSGYRTSWLGGYDCRSHSPKSMPAETSESPICIDGSTPNFI